MSDVIEYKIFGEDMQIVEIELDPGEGVRAEAGAMMYMEQGIEMETSTGGGLFKGFKRAISGESFFITTFLNSAAGKSHIAFGAPYPGKIVALDLPALGGSFLCQKDSFLCAARGVEIEVAFTKRIGAGLFGGEGFVLQQLTGDGLAFVHAGGTLVKKVLTAGETLRVDTGCLAALAPTVDYDIQFVGGFKNSLFGGEGLFLAKLTGPGLVYLQSLPLSRLADRIVAASRFGSNREENRGIGGIGNLGGAVLGAGLLGSLLGGDEAE
ncbi:MAG: TIGR00266 family protein [Firmicutes bacterium]|nr:TIGR00266 family protein [Bacillota bacterium]